MQSHDAVHGAAHAHVLAVLVVHLLDYSKGLSGHALSALVEPHLLQVADLLVEALVLEPIGVYLCLIVLKLCDHILELLGTVLQVLLIDLELFGYLGSTLLGEDILQLDVELLLLLD